jgi:glutamate synthase (NADPH/NADH) small chain
MEHVREQPKRRPVEERTRDWREVYQPAPDSLVRTQAARCMDCGIPFCHKGCPLGNLIPDWNDLVYKGRDREALERLHATNNFPEFTGRLCPAPCEPSCVLALADAPVSIKVVEQAIIDKGFAEGWVAPQPAAHSSGKSVAVVGSGPAGLAAAQQLARLGHAVTVYERSDKVGGLLRYGIPDFKMDKTLLGRRLQQMEAEGVRFVTGVEVGKSSNAAGLRRFHDAVLLACGATQARALTVSGAELPGVHLAMQYLEQQNRVVAGERIANRIDAKDKHVVILGGGDTGADCLGTAHRQGAKSVTQLELMPRPPDKRAASDPWPNWPTIFRSSAAHEEGGERGFAVQTTAVLGTEKVEGLRLAEVRWEAGKPVVASDADREIPCDLLLIAIGFTGAENAPLLEQLGLALNARTTVPDTGYATATPGVFVAGDMRRGASLIVWAIAEGREAAKAVHAFLTQPT